MTDFIKARARKMKRERGIRVAAKYLANLGFAPEVAVRILAVAAK